MSIRDQLSLSILIRSPSFPLVLPTRPLVLLLDQLLIPIEDDLSISIPITNLGVDQGFQGVGRIPA